MVTVFSEKLLFKFFLLSNRVITFIFYTLLIQHGALFFVLCKKKKMMVPAVKELI